MRRVIQTLALLWLASLARAENLTVLAAASTMEAMTEIGTLFTAKSDHTVQFSFGSAGALARQIQNGAPADVFISANEQWMDTLEKDGKINPASRVSLLANRLVLVVPAGKVPPEFRISNKDPENVDGKFLQCSKFFTRCSAVPAWRLAIGDMQSVPVGMYTKQMLEKYGWLEALTPRLVSCDSVRNVLFFVERGEVDAGIVYSTDAKISDRVTVVTVFPEECHDPIRYPAAVCTASARPAAAAEFLAFLRSDEARAVFEKLGFSFIAGDVR